jgi:shikimate kinase/3-dehydroquinate synthase
MGAGKTTVGAELARRAGVPFADADAEIERDAGRSIAELFATEGEPAFRDREQRAIERLLAGAAGVVAVGGGALGRPLPRRDDVRVVWLDVDADVAWERVRTERAGRPVRPLAADAAAFRRLHAARIGTYAAAADALVDAAPPPAAVAAAIEVVPDVRSGAPAALPTVIGDRRAFVVADRAVDDRVPAGTAGRLELAAGEAAKSVAGLVRLWRAFADAGLERRDVVVAAGGGTVTDVAGFAAATFRRGLAWIAVPTTLVGQLDAAIGGKTGVNVAAKNDVGAFHLPEAVLANPELLATLPPREWAAGFAEAVKTGLLAGADLHRRCLAWGSGIGTTAERVELVRRAAAYKARVVAEDPHERGVRAVLNLGHTIGHAVEAAAGYGTLLHGEAVAIGLSAALWLSVEVRGLDPAVLAETEAALTRAGLPVRAPGVGAAAVREALGADKKRARGRVLMVLLDAVGAPVFGVDPGDDLVRAAVERAVS